jgi:Sulfatase-modifying factor enzyme 1
MKLFVPRISITKIPLIQSIVVAIFSLAAVTNSARGQLYGVENDTGNLYRISTANAALSLVGNTGASLLGSLEYRPSNGFLYAIGSDPLNTGNTNGLLYRINPANASTTLVGSIGPEHVFEGGLVIAPDGTAYATNMNFNENPALFKINLDTAATTTVGIISGGGHDINGLAWRSDNMLVGLDRVTDSLLVINPSTAASSVIAAVSAPIGGVGGMAAIGDSGYFATGNLSGSNSLYSFNLNSGAHALIGNFAPTIAGIGISGLALVVPEPASVTLAALAIVVALSLRNRPRAFPNPTCVASLILFCAVSLVAFQSASAVTISTVPVGNVGNANDPATGNLYGGVGYAYNIGKYEVTVGQYTAFLSAVAATDTYGLYNTGMTGPSIAGIARSGASGSYIYSVIGSPDHPITYVGWGDAARFANWLHNGQPAGAQNSSTTEDGAYTLNGATSKAALNAVSRNAGAKWFIPSENEWYKAAYYQPAAQGGRRRQLLELSHAHQQRAILRPATGRDAR